MSSCTVALGLGANLADARATLRDAVDRLRAATELAEVVVSPLYRTAPVGGPPQPDYLNAVIVARTDATAGQLWELAQGIEQAHVRVRDVRWGPRTLDIDILAIGDQTSDDPHLTLPHPRAHRRAFVLVPWAAVDPDFFVAGRGTVAELLAAIPAAELQSVALLPGCAWWDCGTEAPP